MKVLKKILPIFLVPVLVAIAGCTPETTTPTPGTAGTLPDLTGKPVKLIDGQPVMINFWATWCPPCRAEIPLIEQVSRDWTPKGLRVFAVNIGESEERVKSFMLESKLTFTVLLDKDQSVAQKYGVQAIPTTIFIDKDGNIKERYTGAFPDLTAIENNIAKIFP